MMASTSAPIRSLEARLAYTVSVSTLRSSSRPAPVRADVSWTRASVKPSESSSRRRSDTQSSAWAAVSRSDWFRTTMMTDE